MGDTRARNTGDSVARDSRGEGSFERVIYTEYWHETFGQAHRKKLGSLVRSCSSLAPGSRVLDLGCGDGVVSAAIAQAAKVTVIGLDTSPGLLRAARQRIDHVVLCDLESGIPVKASSVDAVICSDVLEHITDVDNFLQESHSVLRNGGLFILSVPNLASIFDRAALLLGFQPFQLEVSGFGKFGDIRGWKRPVVGHIRGFTLRAIKQLLSYHGFKVKSIKGTCGATEGFARLVDRLIVCFPAIASELVIVPIKSDGGPRSAGSE